MNQQQHCQDCGSENFLYANAEITCKDCGLIQQERMPVEDVCTSSEFSSVLFKHSGCRHELECIQTIFNLSDWQVEDLCKMYDAYKIKVKKDHNHVYVLLGLIYYTNGKTLTFEQLCSPCGLNVGKFPGILTTIKDALSTNKEYSHFFITYQEDKKISCPSICQLELLPYYSQLDTTDIKKIRKLLNTITERLNSAATTLNYKKIIDSFEVHIIHIGILYISLKMLKKQMCKVGTFAETFKMPIGYLFKIENALKDLLSIYKNG